MTPNGVFGIKINAPRKENNSLIQELASIPGIAKAKPTNYAVWENAFPNGKHIHITRRSKVRQAVSWWKAIVTEEWHRTRGEKRPYSTFDISERYNFNAIQHLLIEATFLESKIQAFLDEGDIVPLTIVYEDFVREYEKTIKRVIDFLGIGGINYPIDEPCYEQLADEISNVWVERFRKEMQKDWKNIIW